MAADDADVLFGFGDEWLEFSQRATCPTCGQRLLIDYEFVPRFIAHFDDEEASDGGE